MVKPSQCVLLHINGFKNGEDDSVIYGLVISAPSGSTASAGTHSITPSGALAANYDISFASGTLTVDKASLIVTANDDAKFLTQPDPATFQGVIYSGFKYGTSLYRLRCDRRYPSCNPI